MKKYKAFTLAEVLVTLIVLGVISAMTIPTLKKTSDEKIYIAGLLKAQSELVSASKMLRQKYGPIPLWVDLSSDDAGAKIMKMYKEVMPPVSTLSSESVYEIRELNGNPATDLTEDNYFNSDRSLITGDGIIYGIMYLDSSCMQQVGNPCLIMVVDVNGKKEPNMYGIDLFVFGVSKSADILPFPGICDPKNKKDQGWGCTSRAISEKNISW